MRRALAARLFAAAALALLAAAASPVRAARFGVPGPGGASPPGYFILTNDDVLDPAVSVSFGDVAHELTLYIEVTGRGLQVDLYDAGLFDPAGAPDQLDLNVDDEPPVDTGTIRYVLFDPMDVVVQDTSFGADDVTTEQVLFPFHDDPAAMPGVYRLWVSVPATVEETEDIAVFGVSVPGYRVYTYNLTAGHSNASGATVTEPIGAYPDMSFGTPGADPVGPVCGAAFITFDMDAAMNGVEPPTTEVTTPQGYVFAPPEVPPSGDAVWWQTDLAGVNAGFLDSDDHGAWRWDFRDLDAAAGILEDAFGNLAPPIDFNAFSIQVLDYATGPRDFLNWPDLPPFASESPRRIYLPDDADQAPLRESLGHRASIVGGFPELAIGETSTVEVTLTLRNPNAYPLAMVSGETHVVPAADVTDPTMIMATGGLAAMADPGDARRILFTGDVPPATDATVTYRVDVTPADTGRFFLTGDGAAFVSATSPTVATYQVPYTPSFPGFPLQQEVLGPACDIEYESVIPSCLATADLVASALETCPGTPVDLDASGSEVLNCPGGEPAYRWWVNGELFQDWSDQSMLGIAPVFDDTWQVEVACSTDLDCNDTAEVTFSLYPEVLVDLGTDRDICPGDSVDLMAIISNGTPPFSPGQWTTDPPGEDGDGAMGDGVTVSPSQTTTYTYEVTDDLGCRGSASVLVNVRSPVVTIAPAEPVVCPGGSIPLDATPGFATYEWDAEGMDPGADGATTEQVVASVIGVTYTVTVTDDLGCPATASVTLQAAPDDPPSSVGPSLRLDRRGDDVRYTWTDAPEPATSFQGVALDCPSPPGGTCATDPTAAALAAQPTFFDVPPGTQVFDEIGAVPDLQASASWLVFIKVRGTSPCSATPGPFFAP